MYRLLQHLTHAMWIALWISATILIGIWTLPGAVTFLGMGLVAYVWALKRGMFRIRSGGEEEEGKPQNTEQEAKFLVTQVLRSLTQVQVAYLCQDFKSERDAREWLKQTLPRGYRKNLGELLENLEAARQGKTVPGVELALRIMARRQELLDMIAAIDAVHADYPDHIISNPVIFVITENMTIEDSPDPLVVIVAGWNPARPTLLPHVDALTFFSEEDGGRQIRGQAEFDGALAALGGSLKRVKKEPRVYAAAPADDPVKRGVAMAKIPLGFVIGTAELV